MTISVRPPQGSSLRVGSADAVRGIASLMVCLFHLCNHLPKTSPLNFATKHWGLIGVFMFFAVSGFVVPYSLRWMKPAYRIAEFPRYILRRMLRLDPPYFASILLAISVTFAANLVPGYGGRAFDYTVPQLLLHLGYLNGIAGYYWVNGVYWTLSLEFQYYIAVGLLFPWLNSSNTALSRISFWGLFLLSFLPTVRTFAEGNNYSVFVYDYFPIFLMGFAVFRFRESVLSVWEFWGTLLVLMAVPMPTSPTIVAFCASLFIAHASITPNRFLAFLSTISYSLYLVHVPIGRSLVHLLHRVLPHQFASDVFIVLISTLVCFAVAYATYLWIEKPSIKLANHLRHKMPSQDPVS